MLKREKGVLLHVERRGDDYTMKYNIIIYLLHYTSHRNIEQKYIHPF